MQSVTFRLSDELHERLLDEAERRDERMSEIIREALEEKLAKGDEK